MPRQHRFCRGVGVELAGLAVAASAKPIGPVGLDNAVAGGGEFFGDRCALAVGTFSIDRIDVQVVSGSFERAAVTVWGSRGFQVFQSAAQDVSAARWWVSAGVLFS